MAACLDFGFILVLRLWKQRCCYEGRFMMARPIDSDLHIEPKRKSNVRSNAVIFRISRVLPVPFNIRFDSFLFLSTMKTQFGVKLRLIFQMTPRI